MGAEALVVLPRDLPRPALQQTLAACPFSTLARILSRLLQRPVAAAAVQDRAVGLGLTRLSAGGAPASLAPEKASRLLLAGYELPALAETATAARVGEHLAARRLVFLILGQTVPAAVQLHAVLPEDSPAWALASACVAHGPAVEEVPAGWLFGAWEAAGRLTVAAARCWGELTAGGQRFFGGTRDRDGSLHWDAADCDTDGTGRLLRCW
jgi:hypothetical protein